jgi:site-specific recombinase XerD
MQDTSSLLTHGFLTEDQVERLTEAAAASRHGLRNATLIWLSYKHALRVSEVIDLRIGQISFKNRTIFCRRLKGSDANQHPLESREMEMLEALLKDRRHQELDPVFVKTNGQPLTRRAVWKIVNTAGIRAGLGSDIHPHKLKHATGYALINKGKDLRLVQAYMGHRQVMNTVRYTAVDANRFAGMWN